MLARQEVDGDLRGGCGHLQGIGRQVRAMANQKLPQEVAHPELAGDGAGLAQHRVLGQPLLKSCFLDCQVLRSRQCRRPCSEHDRVARGGIHNLESGLGCGGPSSDHEDALWEPCSANQSHTRAA
jgi:hypothetical protein